MAGVTSDAHLYEDRFQITAYDQSKYDRVARLSCTSLGGQTTMELDINIELFPCAVGEELYIVLATSLSPDGSKDEGVGWREQARTGPPEPSLADNFDYVCRGKIYKFVEGEDQSSIAAYLSFGGLLMCLEGPYKKLTSLRVEYTYLLIRK
ncbi:putative dna-directed rna polymerases i protein [Zalerion maritima]|uniref:DNA-directed RNA polymerases I, II, and III subunit RPABC3 n=1 Tax=Zalerion maritima TaxID=339359 RepID=A0AAD5RRQ1_9PEZI|nr:putative dna-directed rna polymerases i protein [Zalerion maritima]